MKIRVTACDDNQGIDERTAFMNAFQSVPSNSSALPANICPFRPSAVKWLRDATDLIVHSVRPRIKRFLRRAEAR
jgi:hypothetical protein